MSSRRAVLNGVALAFAVFVVALAQPVLGDEIHELAGAGDLDGVQRAITGDPKLINARDEDGRTPLFTACRGDDLEVVKYLVARGADINAKDGNLSSPMHALAHRNHADAMKVLIEKGAEINAQDHSKHTPLHLAALADHKAAVGLLIDAGAELDMMDDYGRTPLILCARERGGPEVAKALLDAGANVNIKDKFDDDALELAAWRGKEELVNLLLDAGAKVPTGRPDSREMLEYAVDNGLARLFRAVIKAGGNPDYELPSGGTLVHSAAAGGSLEILKVLASKGLGIDMRDDYGWTPLHYAARDGRADCVTWLCEKEVKIDGRTLMGQTAYNIAQEREMTPVAEVLKAAKADTAPMRFPALEGPYLGQEPPGEEPQRFATGIVSSVWGLHSSIAFSPEGDVAFWSPMVRYPGEIYSRSNIAMMSKRENRWAPPRWAPFTGEDRGDVAFLAPGGDRVYFLSRRTLPDEPESRRERIWFSDRRSNGWAPARLVDQVVNDYPQHWQFSVDGQHTIYFSSNLPEGQGGGDIYQSEFVKGKWQKPVNPGRPVNSESGEGTPYIAPDGSYLIFGRDGDLFISYRTNEGAWSQPQDVGHPINSTSRELCPIVSPDGKYLFFVSWRLGSSHVFWVSAGFIDRMKPAGEQIED